MADYPYEELGPERFQEFVQALLVKTFPNLQCLPVAMPDGGRDAVSHLEGTTDGLVLQVKFRRPTPIKEATSSLLLEWVIDKIAIELPNIRSLAEKGARQYIFSVNVPCTSHPESGIRDRMQNWLDENLPMPAQVMWREDLNRRLDSEFELKREYGLLRGQQALEELTGKAPLGSTDINFSPVDTRLRAVKGYLRRQYDDDRRVKFKQVDLHTQSLLDLFVDVPVLPKSMPSKERTWFSRRARMVEKSSEVIPLSETPDFRDPKTHGKSMDDRVFPAIGAALLLLQRGMPRRFRRIVLEGAPGQGKSTLAQYVCQVHRVRLLDKTEDLQAIESRHKSSPLYLPFHVDLRDLAVWLQQRNPFKPGSPRVEDDWQDSLESFLAAAVRHASGGMEFHVTDINALLLATPTLLVLDGLDEVGDIEDRLLVVRRVTECLSRFEDECPDLNVIVTSRPSLFGKTAGFDHDRFLYLTLADLTNRLMLEYMDGWIETRDLSEKHAAELRRAVDDKLEQPHIRDLARNPMQLAILLWLISRRGVSLPDKRTALYSSYLETFLDREAEKTEIVRDERDLILELHGRVAWELHSRAEQRSSAGNIEVDALRALLRQHLEDEERDTSLVDDLFSGMTQRVMALTSRVQGTFEFEVQPLREYFAARFIYETAKASTPGNEKSGSRSDRFEALVRNPYWLNVTRFFAGFLDKGELAHLADQLDELCSDGDYALSSYARDVAILLLRDQVFTQSVRATRRVVECCVADDVGWRLAQEDDPSFPMRDYKPIVLSKECGGDELSRIARAKLVSRPSGLPLIRLCRTASSGQDSLDILKWCASRIFSSSPEERRRWIRIAGLTGCLVPQSAELLSTHLPVDDTSAETWEALLNAGADRLSELSPTFSDLLMRALRNSTSGGVGSRQSAVGRLAILTGPERLSRFVYYGDRVSLEESLVPKHLQYIDAISDQLEHLYRARVEAGRSSYNLKEFTQILMLAERALGKGLRLYGMALAAAGNYQGNRLTNWHDLFSPEDLERPLGEAFKYLRGYRENLAWWKSQLELAKNVEETYFVVAGMISFASSDVVKKSLAELDSRVSSLPLSEISKIDDLIASGMTGDHSVLRSDRKMPQPRYEMSIGLAYLLAHRLEQKSMVRMLQRQANKGGLSEAWATVLSSRILPGVIAQVTNSDAWRLKLPVIRDLYRRSHDDIWPRYYYDADRLPEIPIQYARRILGSPKDYPEGIVSLADRIVYGKLAGEAPSILDISERQLWFRS